MRISLSCNYSVLGKQALICYRVLENPFGWSVAEMLRVWLFVMVVGAVEDCGDNVGWLCRQETLCDKCVQVHECCSFCYDSNYQKSRCDLKENLLNNNCSKNAVETSEASSATYLQNLDFTNYTETGTIQIRPQHFKIKLRKGLLKSVNFQK